MKSPPGLRNAYPSSSYHCIPAMSNSHGRKENSGSEKDLGINLRVEEMSLPPDPSRVLGLSYSGEEGLPAPPVLTPEEEERLWRKIDWHILPIITVMYLCSFVDRSNIGASSVFLPACRNLTGSGRKCEAARHRYGTRPYRR